MEQTKPSAEGLRYRKKLKARLSVERAALELVIERGYDGVTVEDICARAAISKKYLQKIMERAYPLKLPADERYLFDVAKHLEKITLTH